VHEVIAERNFHRRRFVRYANRNRRSKKLKAVFDPALQTLPLYKSASRNTSTALQHAPAQLLVETP
jgi:hypothetical protein